MTNKEKNFFRIAEEVSKTGQHYKVRIGAIIVQKHKIISSGVNSIKTHPKQKVFNKLRERPLRHHFLHAEMDALIGCQHHNLSNAVIYVFRQTKDGKIAMCRPCPACMAALKEAGIKTIYYTTVDGYCKEEIG